MATTNLTIAYLLQSYQGTRTYDIVALSPPFFCVFTPLILGRQIIFNFKMKSESEVAQSCPTLCDPVDSSPPGSSVHGILPAKILEWLAFPSPGDLPDPGIKPRSPALQADVLTSESPGKPILKWKSFKFWVLDLWKSYQTNFSTWNKDIEAPNLYFA